MISNFSFFCLHVFKKFCQIVWQSFSSNRESSDSGVVKGKSKLPYHLAKKLAGTSSSSITTPPLAAPVRGYARLSNRLVRKSSHSSVFASNQPSSVRSASSPLKAVSSVFDGSCSVSSLKYLARNPSFSSFSSSIQSSSLRSISPPSKVVSSVFDGSTAIFSVKSSFSISPLVQNVLNEAIAPNFSACIPLVGLTSSDNTCISRPVVAESMHESSRKCGVCKLGGHDRRNCPTRKSASDDAKIAEVVLSVESKQSVLDFQETVCEPKINSSISLTCLFCAKSVSGKNKSNRPLLVCFDCSPIDVCRPQFRIPIMISPMAAVNVGTALRSVTQILRGGIWNPAPFGDICCQLLRSPIEKLNLFLSLKFQNLVLRGQFSSALSSLNHTLPAEVSVETVEKLKKLHPVEEFSGNPVFGELSMSYWTNKPVLVDEILQLISSSPSGRAAGPSGMSFDHFKIAVNAVPEICEDLAVFFNEVLLGTKKLPHALCSSRLVALSKPNGGVRPIAVGETISRIFSTLCFRRVRDSSVEFFRPFQFAVGVPDGTTCAALTSDFHFHSNEENAILNIDFKNAFNCVLRSTISDELSKFFPQLIPYFNIFLW
ncbi:hypothetical protein GEMRC1_007770 [Eukaryota sp. GEM-RC1]